MATVRNVGAQLVLDDPEALGVIRAVEKHNLRTLLDQNRERVEHFTRRADELGRSPLDVVIVILAVDDPFGGALADALMPGHDWQAIRARGEIPLARGLAGRAGIQDALDSVDPEAGKKLWASESLSVVVVDRGVAEVFPAVEGPER